MSLHKIPFSVYPKKESYTKLSQICSYGNSSYGLKHEFETAMVNEPSVIEPLKLYCIFHWNFSRIVHKAKFTVAICH